MRKNWKRCLALLFALLLMIMPVSDAIRAYAADDVSIVETEEPEVEESEVTEEENEEPEGEEPLGGNDSDDLNSQDIQLHTLTWISGTPEGNNLSLSPERKEF